MSKHSTPNVLERTAAPMPAGAGEGPVEIVEYDPAWPDFYRAECERLAHLLPSVLVQHIGSTSVPGLAAKPVIDMIALVEDLDAAAAAVRAGYTLPLRFNAGLVHRRFLCYPSASHRTHHLHLVDRREDIERCLRFRDLLLRDRELAEEYAALKRSLAARFREDREGYTEAKSAFIDGCAGAQRLARATRLERSTRG
jgi:GrpB-like predicted nucleotidyltransferase (UPF0157 family)